MLGAASQGNHMRYVWAVLASAWCGCVWAQDCSALKGDEYATCNAVQQNNPRFCEDISSKDQRLFCMARIQPNSYTCEKITSSSTRFDCLSYVKNKQFSLIWSFNGSKPKN
jgi:hypothetical protein